MPTFPQTHARSLVSAYQLCDRLQIPAQDSHRAALWLDRHGISGNTVDDLLNKSIAIGLDNPLAQLLNLSKPAVFALRGKHDFKQLALLGEMVRDRAFRG